MYPWTFYNIFHKQDEITDKLSHIFCLEQFLEIGWESLSVCFTMTRPLLVVKVLVTSIGRVGSLRGEPYYVK